MPENGSYPTVDQLVRHARRYGVEGVAEVGAEILDEAGLGRLEVELARMGGRCRADSRMAVVADLIARNPKVRATIVAAQAGVSVGHARKLMADCRTGVGDRRNRARNPAAHAGSSAHIGLAKGIGRPVRAGAQRALYGGEFDPVKFDIDLDRARRAA